MIRTLVPWEELQLLETLQRLFLREAGIRPPWRKEPLGEKSKSYLKTRERREEYREEFIESLDSFGPDAKDGAGGGTGSLMARNDWREQFCLVLLPRPLQTRKQNDENTGSQSWEGAVHSMDEKNDDKEREKGIGRHGSYIHEDQENPILVNETIVA